MVDIKTLTKKIKEFAIYLILGVMIILELFDEAKEQVFYDEFRDHVIIMENFLSGWSQYDRLVSEGEANISLMLNENNLPPFSCEAVFIREHIVEVK